MDVSFCLMLFQHLLRWSCNFYPFYLWMLNHYCDCGLNPAWSCLFIIGFSLQMFCWKYLHLCSSKIMACNFLSFSFSFFVVSLSGFVIIGLVEWIWKCSILKFFWNGFQRISSVQALSWVRLFVTPWTAVCQASLSITNSRSLPKLMFIESPSNHLILCHPLLLLPLIPPSIRVFSRESALCSRWPKYWSFSFNISPSN